MGRGSHGHVHPADAVRAARQAPRHLQAPGGRRIPAKIRGVVPLAVCTHANMHARNKHVHTQTNTTPAQHTQNTTTHTHTTLAKQSTAQQYYSTRTRNPTHTPQTRSARPRPPAAPCAAWRRPQSQKDRPLFPGPDEREFWQRAEARNRETAALLDKLGLPVRSGARRRRAARRAASPSLGARAGRGGPATPPSAPDGTSRPLPFTGPATPGAGPRSLLAGPNAKDPGTRSCSRAHHTRTHAHARTHARTHTHTHARAHARTCTHANLAASSPPPPPGVPRRGGVCAPRLPRRVRPHDMTHA
jgi:hypothetical protein